LITRSAEGNPIEKTKLEKLGAKVVELAAIKITAPSSWTKLDHAIAGLNEFDWIVFTSANGVHAFFKRCCRREVSRKFLEELKTNPSNLKFACVGPSTKHALEDYGFKSDFVPREFLTRSLAEELAKSFPMMGKKLLLARAEGASKEISRILKASGAEVIEAGVYGTRPQTRKVSKEVLDSLTDITLTSPSTVEGLIRSVPAGQIRTRAIFLHCIGPVTANRAKEKGFAVHSIAKMHTIDGLIESIVESQHIT
jgi:uroporphyrinogen-III synthase